MHARIEHLLSLRDGQPVEADVAEHVAQCGSCSEQLHGLSARREQLRSLPQLDADPAAWERIQARLSQPADSNWQRKGGLIAASAAVLVLSIVALVALRDRGTPPEHEPPLAQHTEVEPSDAAHVSELVARSQQLDQLLQSLPERPRIERVSTAAVVDTIEGRIQWLDYQISYAPDDAASDARARRLWRERVELMDSLVKVRYAEASNSSF